MTFIWHCVLIWRNIWSRIHRAEAGADLLIITPSNPLGESVLPISAPLGSASLEYLKEERNPSARRHSGGEGSY